MKTPHTTHDRPGHAETRTFRRFLALGALLVFITVVALLVPVVRVAFARPSGDTVHAEAFRQLVTESVSTTPGERSQLEMLLQIQLAIIEAIEPLKSDISRINRERFAQVGLGAGIDSRCVYQPQISEGYYDEYDREYPFVAEINATSRDYSRRAVDALLSADVFAGLDTIEHAALGTSQPIAHPSLRYYSQFEIATYEIAGWLDATIRFAAERGDWETAASLLEAWLALSRSTARLIDPMSTFKAISLEETRLAAIRDLALRKPPPAALRRLLTNLQSDPLDLDLSATAEAQRLMLLDFGELTHSRSGVRLPATAGVLFDEPIASTSILNVPGLFMPRHDTYIRTVNEFVAMVQDSLVLSRSERIVQFDSAQLDELIGRNSSFPSYAYAPVFFPGLFDAHDRFTTAHNATLAILATELHRAEHHQLPASLDDLVGPYLTEKPFDAESAAGDFTYSFDSQSTAGYRLFSLTREWQQDPQ